MADGLSMIATQLLYQFGLACLLNCQSRPAPVAFISSATPETGILDMYVMECCVNYPTLQQMLIDICLGMIVGDVASFINILTVN